MSLYKLICVFSTILIHKSKVQVHRPVNLLSKLKGMSSILFLPVPPFGAYLRTTVFRQGVFASFTLTSSTL
jgi:hypothetical protein